LVDAMMVGKRLVCALLALCMVAAGTAFAQQSNGGELAGSVVDEATGRGLGGATIVLGQDGRVTLSDAAGRYRITEIEPGVYPVRVFKAGYPLIEISGVEITAGTTRALDIAMAARTEEPEVATFGGGTASASGAAPSAEDVFELDALVVTAEEIEDRDVEMLTIRKAALGTVDGISSDTIARLAAGDAAEALTRVTGVSIADGKYAVVRGLNDRYNNTRLNGVVLPSPDPDRQAVQLDLFPSDLIDNIVVSKTFTPDLPGDTSGGSVNIRTSFFPLEEELSVSGGIQFSESALSADFYPSYNDGGDMGLLAAGSRDRASPGDGRKVPFYLSDGDAPFAYDFSVSYGKTYDLDGQSLGLLLAVTYDQSVGFIDGFTENRLAQRYRVNKLFGSKIVIPGDLSEGTMRLTSGRFDLVQAVEEVALAGLAGLSYTINTRHTIGLTLFHTRNGTDIARGEYNSYFDPELKPLGGSITNLPDTLPGDLEDPRIAAEVGLKTQMFNEEFLYYSERVLSAASLSGTSYFGDRNDLQMDWSLTRAETSQEEPDFRQTIFLTRWNEDLTAHDPAYFYSGNSSDFAPQLRRTWREIDEVQDAAILDFIRYQRILGGRDAEIRFGAAWQNNNRDVLQQDVLYSLDSIFGDSLANYWDNVFDSGSGSVGIPSSATGEREIAAGYLFVNLPLIEHLKLMAGVRWEDTRFDVSGNGSFGLFTPETFYNEPLAGDLKEARTWQFLAMDSPTPAGAIDQDDWLPAVGLVYELTPAMNLRASWSKTVARPAFREIMPYFSVSVGTGGDLVIGNPHLRMSDITNYDLRWEWFHGENQQHLLAISGFAKTITNPIEKQLLFSSEQRRFIETWRNNGGDADVYGLELEIRQGLGFVHNSLEHFTLSSNLTWIEASVPIEEQIRVFYAGGEARLNNPQQGGGYAFLEDVPTERRLFDQPEWILNLDIAYNNPDWGFEATLAWYAISSVLSGAGSVSPDAGTFDRYTAAYDQLDLVLRKSLGDHWKIGLSIENLTDTARGSTYGDDTAETLWQTRYHEGRSYSISATREF